MVLERPRGGVGRRVRRRHLAGEAGELLLDGLELRDRTLERDPLARVLDREVEDRLERPRDEGGARGGPEEPRLVEGDRPGADRDGRHGVEIERSRGSPATEIPSTRPHRARSTSATRPPPSPSPARATTATCSASRANGTLSARPRSVPSAPSSTASAARAGAATSFPAGTSSPARASTIPATRVSARGAAAAKRPAAWRASKPSRTEAPAPPASSGTHAVARPVSSRAFQSAPRHPRPPGRGRSSAVPRSRGTPARTFPRRGSIRLPSRFPTFSETEAGLSRRLPNAPGTVYPSHLAVANVPRPPPTIRIAPHQRGQAEAAHEVRNLRDGRHRRDRLLSPRREPRLRLGVGDGQPDAVLRLLRGARPRRPTDDEPSPRDRRLHLRHPDPAGARRRDGDPEPSRPRAGPPRDRDRQHRDALDGPAPDADPRLRRVPAGAPRPPRAARRWTTSSTGSAAPSGC